MESILLAELSTALTETKHGRMSGFPASMAPKFAVYVSNELGICEFEDVMAMGAEAFSAALDDFSETKLPPPLKIMLVSWFIQGSKGVAGTSPNSKPKAPRPVKEKEKDFDLESEAGDGPGVGDTTMSREELKASDAKKMGFEDGDSITALDRSIYSGQIQDKTECEGEPYGVDTAYTEFARKLKKMDVETLPEILKSKEGAMIKAKAHFTSLMRQYNAIGASTEVTNISSFVTCTDELFAQDPVGYVSYVKAYRQKFKGRAFVREVDVVLVIKHKSANGAAVSTVKEEVAQVKTAVAKMATTAAVERLTARLTTLEQRVASMGSAKGPAPPGEPGQKPCGYCKLMGHYARDCPKKAADEAAAAAKAAAADEEE
jgi:hypothetical protein